MLVARPPATWAPATCGDTGLVCHRLAVDRVRSDGASSHGVFRPDSMRQVQQVALSVSHIDTPDSSYRLRAGSSVGTHSRLPR